MAEKIEFDTLALRAGIHRSQFGEHSEAMYLTSSFVFENAAQAAARFTGGAEGNIYSRFTNPTVTMFQERLAALEGAEACVATASGMSAILATSMALLKAGDHVVCSASVFGSTVQLFSNIMGKFGIETTYVDGASIAAWEGALRKDTKLLFLETPSNPLTEIADIAALAAVCKRAGAVLAVDNCLCTPALQQPLELGADLVIHSATKYLDGQGRVLGGAVLGARGPVMDSTYGFLRTAGPTLSAFNAWVLLKGAGNAQDPHGRAAQSRRARLAQWLEDPSRKSSACTTGPRIASPARACDAAAAGQRAQWFPPRGEGRSRRRVARSRLNAHDLDYRQSRRPIKSTITHPATTTHGRISPEARERAGIREGLVRVAVGLESLAGYLRGSGDGACKAGLRNQDSGSTEVSRAGDPSILNPRSSILIPES